jgi:Helix-turn-helix domain
VDRSSTIEPTVNDALRAARQAAGFSLDVLAARTNFSKSYLGNVAAGRRRATAEIAATYGLRRSRLPVRKRPTSGWAALTASVAHVLTKLDARSRAEVARE